MSGQLLSAIATRPRPFFFLSLRRPSPAAITHFASAQRAFVRVCHASAKPRLDVVVRVVVGCCLVGLVFVVWLAASSSRAEQKAAG
jgi:hypothetical protein